MRHPVRLAAAVFAAAALGTPGSATDRPAEDKTVHRRMAMAGFTPLSEMTYGGREVHRVLAIDPYGIIGLPGIELERHRDGTLTLRAQYRGWAGPAYPVSQDEWDRIAALEPAAYGPPGKSSFKGEPGVVVHCWSGLLEASPDSSAGWWACDKAGTAAQAYGEAVLDLAIRKMACPPDDREIWWRFATCTGAAYTLDDPRLQQQLVALRARWTAQRDPGSDILATARLALRAARADATPARIADARTAVLAFGRQQDALRAIVQSSFALFPDMEEKGGRNAVLITETRQEWLRDIEDQNRNYIELLEALVEVQSGNAAR